MASLDLHASLRNYQWEGVSFLTSRTSALLADQMGLGKTVQVVIALRLLLQQPGFDRSLVVVPASLRLNWENEFARWAPDLVVRRVLGTSRDRIAYYRLPIPVLIASYEQLRIDAPDLPSDVSFDVTVLDEAQRIKNADSTTALASRLIRRKRAWALTGTPMENKLEDLLSVYNYVQPGLLRPGMNRTTIHDLMQESFLRRTKLDVLPELPPIISQDMDLELMGCQKEAYDQLWDSRFSLTGKHQAGLFAFISQLKQLCNYDPASGESIKLDALSTIVEGLTDDTDKLIVFSQYVRTLEWLSTKLSGLPFDFFHGRLDESARQKAVHRFQELPGPRILLVSLRAGGVGLNLQAASIVVLFDRWWNPAVESQAVERAHRFGRDRPLHVVRFLVRSTIEEHIDELLQRRRVLFERYIEQAPNADVQLPSRRELLRLLRLEHVDGSEPEPIKRER